MDKNTDDKENNMLNKKQVNLIIKLLSGLSHSSQKDIQTMLSEICEGELKEHDGDALADHFKGNVKKLSSSLSNDQKQEAVLCIHQVAKAEDRASLEDETLKLLMECLVAVNQGDKQHKKMYYRQFIQGVSFDFEKDDDEIKFNREALMRLGELMIIVGMADTLEDEEVDIIYGVFLELWEGPHNEVGAFLAVIFKELDDWTKKGESLVDHFRTATQELAKLCDRQQIEKIKEILEEFIGADDRVSAQERILYKIFKDFLG